VTVRILTGDCRDVLKTLPDASVDSIVTDPPYGLAFMGKKWDYDVPCEEVWRECLRVLKPGGHLLAFSGTRTQHRMAVRIEDAGFEIRDMIAWVYSSGFPKSLNLDRFRGEMTCGCEGASESKAERDMRSVRDADVSTTIRDGEECGQVLQPGLPQQGASAGQVQRAAASERACEQGMEGRCDDETPEGELQGRALRKGAGMGAADGAQGRLHHGAPTGHGHAHWAPAGSDGSCGSLGPQPVEQCAGEPGSVSVERGSQARGGWPVCAGCRKPMVPKGLGTALKPALEPITVARKPLAGTVAENVLEHGTGALNIGVCRVEAEAGGRPLREVAALRNDVQYSGNALAGRVDGSLASSKAVGATDLGRWPANLIHDGSDEVLQAFPDAPGQSGAVTGDEPSSKTRNTFALYNGRSTAVPRNDTGSAARFFYCAKADKADRGEGNTHPTVKPADLMRYLCRLVTPRGGTVLDPFAGSGSTLLAADREGFDAIGIEMNPQYAEMARRRIHGDAPLFAEVDGA